MTSPKVAFITLTNSGYVDYTLNCYESLKNINSKLVLQSFCIGKEGFDILTQKGHKCTFIENRITEFQSYKNSVDWWYITLSKLSLIYVGLLNNDYVLLTDGDIVYEKNGFCDYLLENIGDNDMLCQQEGFDENGDMYYCTGFMFIKSNEKTIDFFHEKNTSTCIRNDGIIDDQDYINLNLDKIKIAPLPLELFPNGRYYYENSENISPYMIHFNWVVGHEKKEKMKKHGKWFLP